MPIKLWRHKQNTQNPHRKYRENDNETNGCMPMTAPFTFKDRSGMEESCPQINKVVLWVKNGCFYSNIHFPKILQSDPEIWEKQSVCVKLLR